MNRIRDILYVLLTFFWGGATIHLATLKNSNPFITTLFGMIFILYLIAIPLELYSRHQKKEIKKLQKKLQNLGIYQDKKDTWNDETEPPPQPPSKYDWEKVQAIFVFCGTQGNGNADWHKLAREGAITEEGINNLTSFIKTGDRTSATQQIQHFIPGFELKDSPTETREQPQEVTVKVEKIIEDEVKRRLEEKEKKEEPPPPQDGDLMYIRPPLYNDVLHLMKNGEQVLIYGGAGAGKTRMLLEISKDLDRPSYLESFAGGKRYSQIFGATQIKTKRFLWSMKQISGYQQTEFLKALQRPGIVIIDEIMSGEEGTVKGLNPICEKHTRQFQTPEGIVNVHPKCLIVATSNTSGREGENPKYTGDQPQDASVLDRFVKIPMEYDPPTEKKILEYMKLEPQDVKYFTDRLKDFRQKLRLANIDLDASTRLLITCAEIYKSKIRTDLKQNRERAFELAFLTSLTLADQGALDEQSTTRKKEEGDE